MFSGAAMMKYECKSLHWTDVAQFNMDFNINLEAKLTASCCFLFVFLSFLTQREKEVIHFYMWTIYKS